MEDEAWSWKNHENNDELRQKLVFATLELKSVKMKANEEMKRNREAIEELRNAYREDVTNLLNLLNTACQERDEAKFELQKLLNMLVPPQMQPDNHFASSSISESNTTTFPDSFLEGASSTDFSNLRVADAVNVGYVNQSMVRNDNCYVPPALVYSEKPKMDAMDILLEIYTKGKALPEKGRLCEAVMQAGPLLETLLKGRPTLETLLVNRPKLPLWNNPPPLSQFKAPSFIV